MVHKEVLGMFGRMFPEYREKMEMFFPNGRNSVRVRFRNGEDYVFTYNSPKDWCFESLDSFIGRLRNRR